MPAGPYRGVMTLRKGTVAFVVASVVAGPALAQSPSDAATRARVIELRASGLEHGYNLDHDAALAIFERAIAADPGDPASHRLAAATRWIKTLIAQGAVTAEDFLGQAGATLRRPPASADLEASIARAVALAEQRVATARRGTPEEVSALFEAGAAFSLQASYTATVGGGVQKSLSSARQAYRDHERVLALDGRRIDAGLVVGMYRYAVSVLPIWSRLLARLAGFDSGRATGLQLVEQAAAHSGDARTNARFALIVIYNRERRFDDALTVIEQLQQQYPRNRLLWLEAGNTALRAERFAVARDALQHGVAMLGADPRPRAFGEVARWHYHLGVALAGLGQTDAAERELRVALDGDSLDWVRGRTHLELGTLAFAAGRRPAAVDAFQQAARWCAAGKDASCSRDVATRLRKAGR